MITMASDNNRRVSLDIETTGLSPAEGHRVVEIACVEILGLRKTGRYFHVVIDSECNLEPHVANLLGVGVDAFRGEKRFVEIADEFLSFIDGAVLVLHHPKFDLAVLDGELERIGRAPIRTLVQVQDIQERSLEKIAARPVRLDALAARYGVVRNVKETALVAQAAELIADIWIAINLINES
jgi:DNA polymerase-3 subunit epsilon